MDDLVFSKLCGIFLATQTVWDRMQALEPCCNEWRRLRAKHSLLATRYRMAREMAEPRTLN